MPRNWIRKSERQLLALPSMSGKLMTGWSLAGPLRDDLPAWLLGESSLAGVGIAAGTVVERRNAPATLEAFGKALIDAADESRVESIRGPFLWFF